jgi:K+-transporting ATPase KdpF subunit
VKNVRRFFCADFDSVLSRRLGLREGLRPPLGASMENILSLLIAAAVGAYLFYALLRPEKF